MKRVTRAILAFIGIAWYMAAYPEEQLLQRV